MKLVRENNTLIIAEPIVTIRDSEKVVEEIENMAKEYDQLIIRVENSFSFPSNIIATLERLKDRGKNIHIIVTDDVIYELFKDLNLTRSFTITKE